MLHIGGTQAISIHDLCCFCTWITADTSRFQTHKGANGMSDAAVEALAGAIGSCIAYGLTYPINTISIWQSLTQDEGDEDHTDTPRWLRLVPYPLDELVQYARSRGLRPLYAGIRPFLVATAVSNGVYFYLYSAIRSAVVTARRQAGQGAPAGSTRSADIGIAGSLLVASVAGCINVAVTNPLWLVSLRQQAAQRKPSSAAEDSRHTAATAGSAWAVIRQVYQAEGIRGFWKGLSPALFMVVNPTVQYILYEWLTARLLDGRRKHATKIGSKKATVLSAQDAFWMSALAKLGATLVTYPMLLVKSRMQSSGAASSPEEQYAGLVDAFRRIVRTEGAHGLYKGMQAKMAQTVLGAALLMGIKEHVYNSIRALQAAQRQRALLVAR